mmetsp:Transcript_8270/g.20158  ORF Transcript_8270/g.20158 Transcript_8270/m.20158 type:complete len:246 (-) Transcript_8270:628-1365(-)
MSPVSRVHMRTFSSKPAVKRRLFGKEYPAETVCACARSVCSAWPDVMSQMMVVWSSPPEMRRFESGEKWHHRTHEVWPRSGFSCDLKGKYFQSRSDMSELHVAMYLLLEEVATSRTYPVCAISEPRNDKSSADQSETIQSPPPVTIMLPSRVQSRHRQKWSLASTDATSFALGSRESYIRSVPSWHATAMCFPLGENFAQVIVPPSFAHVIVQGRDRMRFSRRSGSWGIEAWNSWWLKASFPNCP